MSDTTHLGLPLLAAAQAQKHVTHNEALQVLDALVHLTVKDRTLTAPPGSPAEGDRHIVGASPTGAWAGHAGRIAAFLSGGWVIVPPRRGFVALDESDNRLLVHDGAAWQHLASAMRFQDVPMIGINATADATNRIVVRSEAVLFSNVESWAGGNGDVRFTVNKETSGDSASLMFQSGWSARAELGLTGDDRLRMKVSPDGSSWTDALVVETSGHARFEKPPRVPGHTVAGLPSAATAGAGALVFVSNETGGATLAFSDGSQWRRVADRAVVS